VTGTRAPAVSVITLTCNHGPWLAECLESLAGQSFEDWEQIVLDDGSTDGSPEAAERAADPRVRFVRQPRRGVSAVPDNYRRALSLARGELIGFLDGDDRWPPDSLAHSVAALRRSDAVLAWGRAELFGKRSGPVRPAGLHAYTLGTLQNDPVGAVALPMIDPRVTMPFPMTAALLRRTALERIGGLQSRPGLPVMDHPTLLRLSLEGPFRYVDQVLALQRFHPDSVSRREVSQIDLAVYRSIRAFRRRYGTRLPISAPEWREMDALWLRRLAQRSFGRTGLRLVGERRWREAAFLGGWLARTPRVWRFELRRLGRFLVRRRGRADAPLTSRSGLRR
jgi:GT2 family glycosyltransferase